MKPRPMLILAGILGACTLMAGLWTTWQGTRLRGVPDTHLDIIAGLAVAAEGIITLTLSRIALRELNKL